jgi:uncharacterized protein (TIGR02001 family)
MKLVKGLAAVALMACATTASAEFSGNVAVVSDYMWRGITQTAGKPALQGGVDWAGDSGLYAGTWASNIDWGDCCNESVEVDLYAGFAGGETISWDVGYNYYWFPSADDAGDFGEFYFALGFEDWVTAKAWYANDYADSDLEAWYFEANGGVPLPADFSIGWHAGWSDGQYWDGDEYFDWSLGVNYAWRNLEFGLAWVDGSDLDDLDDFCKGLDKDFYPECKDKDVLSTDGRVVLSVATSFPWSKD